MTNSILPDMAQAIAEWFPEIEGRALPVSESEITAENVPTLPLCMLALSRVTADHPWKGNGNIELTEDFLVEFWLKPEKRMAKDGSETPFWAFYNYTAWQDRLIENAIIGEWADQKGYRLEYVSMDIEADHFAVVLTFRFRNHFRWCPPKTDQGCSSSETMDGAPLSIDWSMSPSASKPQNKI